MDNKCARRVIVMLVSSAAPLIYGCGGPAQLSGNLNATEARSHRLMSLAAEEAGKIGDPDMRLTQQLNLADLQIEREWKDDARRTLSAARMTLSSPEAARLNDQARIGGWVSISELSRRIKDMPSAAVATDAALRELDRIEDPGKRCQYVMGLANEVQYIQGQPSAAALLARAGPWTKWIDNLQSKRQALVAFATALFNLDDFDDGQKMLQQETDAAWRSDVLANMAQVEPVQQQAAFASAARGWVNEAPHSVMSLSPATMPPTTGPSDDRSSSLQAPGGEPFYGKSLNYDAVFKNQKNSNTTKE